MPEHGNIRFRISCGYHVFQNLFKAPSMGEKLAAKRKFNNTMDKHAVEVVKSNETAGHLPHKFSRTLCYLLACSGEISVEVIGLRRCGRMAVPWQLAFNFSNKEQMTETLERTTGKQESGLDSEIMV